MFGCAYIIYNIDNIDSICQNNWTLELLENFKSLKSDNIALFPWSKPLITIVPKIWKTIKKPLFPMVYLGKKYLMVMVGRWQNHWKTINGWCPEKIILPSHRWKKKLTIVQVKKTIILSTFIHKNVKNQAIGSSEISYQEQSTFANLLFYCCFIYSISHLYFKKKQGKMNTWPNPQEWSLGPLGRGAMLVNGRRIDPSPAHTYTQSPALSTHTNTHWPQH